MIIDYSKADAGKVELEPRPIVLSEVIESSLDMVALQATQKGLHLGYILGADVPPSILADPARLQQIILNLLSNAMKFTEEGEIVITVFKTKQEELLVSVRDTGIGISEENLKVIFKEYTQVSSSIGHALGGTGLGLAICRQITSLMEGKIWVESQLGIGSAFHCTIPLTPVVESKPSEELTPHRVALVVSKNQSHVLQLKSQLRSLNVDVVWSNSSPDTENEGLISDCNIIFHDYSTCTKQVHIEIEMPPLSRTQEKACLKSFLIVAIVDPGSSVPEGVSFDAILQLPFKKQTISRILMAKGKRKKASQKEVYWENYGQDHPLDILVADDNPVNIKITTRMLFLMGYQKVDIASNGQEAVDRALSSSYDLILMDIYMPMMNGIEATRRIREHDNSVFICGLSGREDRQKYRDAGMNQSLLKPVSMARLFEVLEGCNSHQEFVPIE